MGRWRAALCWIFLLGCDGDASQHAVVFGSGVDSESHDLASGVRGSVDVEDTAMSDTPMAACPAPDPEGRYHEIYDHRVMKATSDDGLDFEVDHTVLLEHASVPDAVVRPDGSIWVYYVNGEPGQHGPFIAQLEDDGVFHPMECVRVDGIFEGNVVDPNIQRLADGRYRLDYYLGWFTGTPPPPGAEHPFYVAFSDDGIHFQVASKTLGFDTIATDPSVVPLPEGGWLMTYAHDGAVGLATSEDGLTFTRTATTFEKGIPELAVFTDGTVRLYASSMEGGMWVYTRSDDGLSWSEPVQTGVMGADPSVIALPEGGYIMYRKTFAGGPSPGTVD